MKARGGSTWPGGREATEDGLGSAACAGVGVSAVVGAAGRVSANRGSAGATGRATGEFLQSATTPRPRRRTANVATDLGASFMAEKDEEGVEPQDRANVRGGLAGARAEEQCVRIASRDFPFDPRGRGNRRLGPGAAAILGWGSSANCSTWADDYRGWLGREG